jgi:hypothetical protein
MIGYAKNHALEPRSMHDLKQMQWGWKIMFEMMSEKLCSSNFSNMFC